MAVTLSEPAATHRLRAHLDEVRSRLGEEERIAIDQWNQPRGMDAAVLLRLRKSTDGGSLQRLADRLAHRAKRIAHRVEQTLSISELMRNAAERPAATSAILWRLNGANNGELTSHLIQVVRERAGLPSLQRLIGPDEPTVIDGAPQLAWFSDRQLADACAWMENVTPRINGTVVEIAESLRTERERARRIPIAAIVPFVKRTASLFLHLSTRGLDPLGSKLGTDAQLDVDPDIDRRLELTRWARTAGHAISLRGHMLTLTIPVQATVPSAVQLIGAELGYGICGGLAFLLRLLGPLEVPALSPAPIMLCLPDDDLDERGARFERWLGVAYPHAAQAWRAWA